MRNPNNQIGNLVTSTSYRTPTGGNEVNTRKVTHSYEFINGVPLIDETRVELEESEAISYFFDYDSYDRVVESRMEYDIPTCYLYDGYNQPVAKIINQSYDQIATLLGYNTSSLENSKDNALTRNILQTLRNQLPDQALMETHIYEPGVGIVEQIDFNRIATYYQYDELGRLKKVLDQDDYVLKEIDYHFGE